MAQPTIRPASVFVNGAKVATGTTNDYNWDGHREQQVADGLVLISEGAQTTDLTIDNLVPYGGDVTLAVIEDAHANGDTLQIAIGVTNGRIHKLDMKVASIAYKSEFKNGTQMMNVKFMGVGKPTIVG